jgi:hypothetical protein
MTLLFSNKQGIQKFSDKYRKELQVKEIFETAKVLDDLFHVAREIDSSRKKPIFKNIIDNCANGILVMNDIFEFEYECEYICKTNFNHREMDFEKLNEAIFLLKKRFYEKNIGLSDNIQNIEKYGNMIFINSNMNLDDIKPGYIDNPLKSK